MKRSLNWPKNKITKIEGTISGTVKHFLKQNFYKLLSKNLFYGLLLGVSAVKRSVLGYNMRYKLHFIHS